MEMTDILFFEAIARSFHNHNIMSFSLPPYGSGMLHVIVEYCCNGNLLNYLRSKRNDQTSPLTARHCVDMAAQVATGMEFLASKDVS